MAKKSVKRKDRVQAQYEELPYPHRDPKDEKKRLVTGSPSHLRELRHHLFKGALPAGRPFRVLVAGGGTGDALIMLAQHLADEGADADIHYIDLSSASRKIAEERARRRRLNITFHSGSLLDAAKLGEFDYIDSCGVLHHLPNPQEGFRALKGALAPEGGMGIMVYGTLGRTGVYPMQEMLRMVAADGSAQSRIDTARSLLSDLPETNWLRRNAQIEDHNVSDAGLFDLLLHSQDRSYTVPELAQEVSEAGLRIVSFIDPACYRPESYLQDQDILARLKDADLVEQARFAELLAGNLKKHIVYLTHADRDEETVASCTNAKAIPVYRDEVTQRSFQAMPPGAQPRLELDGIKFPLTLPPQAAMVLRAIDGRRSLEQIHSMMPGSPDWFQFSTVFQQTFNGLHGFGKLFLKLP